MKFLVSIFALFLVSSMAVSVNVGNDVTVGGLSSGAFMAVQMHVAHSQSIKGAAVFAGGPFYCAKGSMMTALTTCMSTGIGIDMAGIRNKISSYESAGKVDPVSNLKGSKVFLFSGTSDYTVNPKVNKETENLYESYDADVKTEWNFAAGHTMPTVDNGGVCTLTSSPFIGKCNYNGAFISMQHLHPNVVKNEPGSYNKNNLFKVSQSGGSSAVMDSDAYVYIPEQCQGDTECSLHVVFHGCQQTIKDIGTQYVELTGYNEVAETNNLVILYPQAKSNMLKNPNGCWDWWGYAGAEYANQGGSQVKVVKDTISKLQSGSITLEQVYTQDTMEIIKE